jgi:hypothetical protein
MCRAASLLSLLIALAGLGLAVAKPIDGTSLPGQRIYRDGVLPSGEPVRAKVQRGVELSGADAACAKCHRRSGLGSSEGSNNIRSIAGRLLFAQPDTARPLETGGGTAAGARVAERPAYNEAALARALRDGIDPAGHALNPLMPRYTMSDADIAQLHTYLGTLSSEPSPGVSDTTIHFATIITPGVSPEKPRAMLEVLQAFVSDKNGGTRKETRRREVGREQMYRAFRTWELHTWELTGPPETWDDQLANHYRQQPVFAVIGGIGGGTWQPVHTFCETFEVPCIFPDVDYPDVTGTGYYPLYFSRGVTLEAEVLAKHLLETRPSAKNVTVVQVYRDNALGRVPAQVLREALLRSRGAAPVDYPLAEGDHLAMETLAKLVGKGRPYVLVVWLGSADRKDLGLSSEPPEALKEIYMSASLSAMRRPEIPRGWLSKLSMVYPFDLPANREQRLLRMKAWLHARKIPLTDERTQANAFFAATVTGDAVSHLGDNFSRDYLIERIEQMTQSSLSPSIYPHLSLGPEQRFASKGGYVIRFPTGADGIPLAISEWLIP